MSLSDFTRSIEDKVRNVGRDLRRVSSRNPLATSTAAVFANPLIAQDIMGSAFVGSALRSGSNDPLASGLAAPTSLATGGSSGEFMDLAAFNAALLAGGAGGALAGPGFAVAPGATASALGLPLGGTAALNASAAVAGTAAVTAAGYTAASGAKADYIQKEPGMGAATPPDINEANDPDLAAQFKRIRKGARMLGRAGTIKYKGSGNLGSGDTLGDQLTVSG